MTYILQIQILNDLSSTVAYTPWVAVGHAVQLKRQSAKVCSACASIRHASLGSQHVSIGSQHLRLRVQQAQRRAPNTLPLAPNNLA